MAPTEATPVSAMEVAPTTPTTSTPTPETSAAKPINPARKRKVFIVAGLSLAVIFIIAVVIVVVLKPKIGIGDSGALSDADSTILTDAKKKFAEVVIDTSTVTPNVPAYVLGDNLANVDNLGQFVFDEAAQAKLEANSFVVVEPTSGTQNYQLEEFFLTYEDNRYSLVPSFITSDSVLHTYHLIFDNTLKTLEQATLYDQMASLAAKLLETSVAQYDYYTQAENTLLQQAALRNIAFAAVAIRSFGQELTVTIPEAAQQLVDQELALIAAQGGISISPLMNYGQDLPATEAFKEDYSQYKPRGHYTKTVRLQQYFQGMMWFGRMTFRTKTAPETASAILLTYALVDNPEAYTLWSDVYDVTAFFVGESDDLTVYAYEQLLPEGKTWQELDATAVEEFRVKTENLEGPAVNSVPIFDASINPDREAEIKGFRLMGQRYSLDADIFQRLVYRDVEANSAGETRMLPSSLDILAAFGSNKARELQEAAGNFDYANYQTNLDKATQFVADYTTEEWTMNLYTMWLYMIKPYVEVLGEGYPQFMQNAAWVAKDMNTFQASWTELKHDTIMYVKQTSAEMGGGGIRVYDDRGYVEPRYEVYARLEALAQATKTGLQNRGMLDFSYSFTETADSYCPEYGQQTTGCSYTYNFYGAELSDSLDKLISLGTNLKNISKKELENQTLSTEDYDFIYSYGGQLEHLWFQSINKPTYRAAERFVNLNENPAMLVADVATDPNGAVLEEGTGRLMEIYTIIPLPGYDGNYYRIAKGVVWSQYEFTQPLDQRLNDKEWQQMVRNDQVPDLAEWKLEYLVPQSGVDTKRPPEAILQGNYMQQEISYCSQFGGTYLESANLCAPDQPDCEYANVGACFYY